MSAHVVGLIIIALPLLIVDFFFLMRGNKPVFLMGILMTAVGIGYLATTGAPAELATTLLGAGSFSPQ